MEFLPWISVRCIQINTSRRTTYNIGAPRDPEGFSRAVGNKLDELRR
jgi:hypothetical protein